jgi:hypothetical protein
MYARRLVRRSHYVAKPPGSPEEDQPPHGQSEPKGYPVYEYTPRRSWPRGRAEDGSRMRYRHIPYLQYPHLHLRLSMQ